MIYVSNVELYLFQNGVFNSYAETMAGLPRTKQSVIIRSIFTGPGVWDLPDMKTGYASASVTQRVRLLARLEPGGVLVAPVGPHQGVQTLVRVTRTDTGLSVTAQLDRRHYPTGIEPTPEQIESLQLKPHEVLPKWNYTISPNL